MELTKEAVMRCRHVGALREFLCQAMDQIDAKDKEIAELKSMNESLHLRADNWKALCLASENAYKKLVKKFVHETSVAESYRSLIYKDDALKYKEEGNLEMYDELSKKSDKAYRHANRLRRIFRKLSQEEK